MFTHTQAGAFWASQYASTTTHDIGFIRYSTLMLNARRVFIEKNKKKFQIYIPIENQSTCCNFTFLPFQKPHKFECFGDEKIFQQYLFQYCCRMIKCLIRDEENSPIINSLCLLKRNNLITRLCYKYNKIFRLWAFEAARDLCMIKEATMFTNHSLLIHWWMLQPCPSLPAHLLCKVSIDYIGAYILWSKHFSQHYCLIKYWFFIMNETWILILPSRATKEFEFISTGRSSNIKPNLYVCCNSLEFCCTKTTSHSRICLNLLRSFVVTRSLFQWIRSFIFRRCELIKHALSNRVKSVYDSVWANARQSS